MKFINLDHVVTIDINDGVLDVRFLEGSTGRYKLCSDSPSAEHVLNSQTRFYKVQEIEDESF